MIFFSLLISLIVAYAFYRKTDPELNKKYKIFLFTMRFISFFIVSLLLFNPILNFVRNKFLKKEVLIMEDFSKSMELNFGDESKKKLFKKKIDTIIEDAEKNNFKVRRIKFAEKTQTSLISEKIEELLKNNDLRNTEEIFLFSDGFLHDGNFDLISDLNIPINVTYPDDLLDDLDLKIDKINLNEEVYLNETTPVEVILSCNEDLKDVNVDLKFASERIDSRKVDISSGYHKIVFDYKPTNIGLQKIEVIVNDQSEINLANNRAEKIINVKDKKKKILIISDLLNWDSSFLNKSLSNYEVDFMHQKKGYFYDKRKRIKLIKRLTNANICIIVNSKNLRFNREEVNLLDNFVTRGGGLIFQGKQISSLKNILPIRDFLEDDFSGQLEKTSLANDYSTFDIDFSDIPPVKYYYVQPKIGSKTLANFKNEQKSAAIIYQKFKQGKILYFSFLDFWKWELWDKNSNYSVFINNCIDWLSNKNEGKIITNIENSYFESENIKIPLKIYDEKNSLIKNLDASIEIKDSTDKVVKKKYFYKENNEYTLVLKDLEIGEYSYEISNANTKKNGKFFVTEFTKESKEFGFNRNLLKYLANSTDGKNISFKESYSFEKAESKNLKINLEIQLYRKWYLIFLFIFCYSLELFFRKRWGLL